MIQLGTRTLAYELEYIMHKIVKAIKRFLKTSNFCDITGCREITKKTNLIKMF